MENNNINELMKSLTELYAKKEYEKAESLLEQSAQVFDKGTYHYNLGTLKAKSGNFALARFHFEKAVKDGYRSEALLNNLAYVKSKIAVDDLSNSDDPMDRGLDFFSLLPLSIFIFSSILVFFLFSLIMKINRSFKIWKIAILVLFAALPIYFKLQFINQNPTAIVIQETQILEGPSSIFEAKGTLKSGAKIKIGKTNEKWAYVIAPQSLVGWVDKSKIETY